MLIPKNRYLLLCNDDHNDNNITASDRDYAKREGEKEKKKKERDMPLQFSIDVSSLLSNSRETRSNFVNCKFND